MGENDLNIGLEELGSQEGKYRAEATNPLTKLASLPGPNQEAYRNLLAIFESLGESDAPVSQEVLTPQKSTINEMGNQQPPIVNVEPSTFDAPTKHEATKSDEKPWWVENTPPIISLPIEKYSGINNNVYCGPYTLADESGRTDNVFVKVFDTQNKYHVGGGLETQTRWSNDAVHQQALRMKYEELYPGEPIPILWSASTLDQEGNRVIIQQFVPDEKRLYKFLDSSVPNDVRRTTYFSFLRQMSQFVYTVAAYNSDRPDHDPIHFFDQKGGDFGYDPLLDKLSVLDVQSMSVTPSMGESVERYGVDNAINSFYVQGFPDHKILLTEEENHMLDTIFSIHEPKRRLSLLLDFSKHQLNAKDERLIIDPISEFENLKTDWNKAISSDHGLTDLRFTAMGLTTGSYDRSQKELYEYSPETEVQKRAWLITKALIDVAVANYHKRNQINFISLERKSADQLNEKQRVLVYDGFAKWMAGKIDPNIWLAEKSEIETEIKNAFLGELNQYLQLPTEQQDQSVSSAVRNELSHLK